MMVLTLTSSIPLRRPVSPRAAHAPDIVSSSCSIMRSPKPPRSPSRLSRKRIPLHWILPRRLRSDARHDGRLRHRNRSPCDKNRHLIRSDHRIFSPCARPDTPVHLVITRHGGPTYGVCSEDCAMQTACAPGQHIEENVALHTSALKCVVPVCIARCIGGSGTLRSADPGNDLTLMGNSASVTFGDCPTSGRTPAPGRSAAIGPASLRASPW